MSTNLTKIFLSNLDIELSQRGITVSQLADMTGIHKTYFSNIKRGRRNAGINFIGQVADALGIPAFKLLIPPSNAATIRPQRTQKNPA